MNVCVTETQVFSVAASVELTESVKKSVRNT